MRLKRFMALVTFWMGMVSLAVASPVISGFEEATLHAEEGQLLFAQSVLIEGGENYSGGYLRFSREDAVETEYFVLLSDLDHDAAGAISHEAGIFYVGTGAGREPIGQIDATENGLYGTALTIHFSEAMAVDDEIVQNLVQHMSIGNHINEPLPMLARYVQIEVQNQQGSVANVSAYFNTEAVDVHPVIGNEFPEEVHIEEDGDPYVVSELIGYNVAYKYLVFTAMSSDESIARAFIENNTTLVVEPQPDRSGSVQISVSLASAGYVHTKTFTLVVDEVNDLPTIQTVPDLSHEWASGSQSNTVRIAISDDEGGLQLSAVSSNAGVIAGGNLQITQIDDSTAQLSYSTEPGASGTTVVTATVTDAEGNAASESFKVSVREGNTAHCVRDLKNALTFERIRGENADQNALTNDLDLGDDFGWVCDASLAWESLDPDVLGDDGALLSTQGPRTAALQATISKAGASETKTFLLGIGMSVGEASAESAQDGTELERDLAALSVESILASNRDPMHLMRDLVKPLPSELSNGSSVAWHSSNEAVVSTYGEVIRPEHDDAVVVLSATLTHEGQSVTKRFVLRVLKAMSEQRVMAEDTFVSLGADEAYSNVTVQLASGEQTGVSASFEAEAAFADDALRLSAPTASQSVHVNTDGSLEAAIESGESVNRLDVGASGADMLLSSTGACSAQIGEASADVSDTAAGYTFGSTSVQTGLAGSIVRLSDTSALLSHLLVDAEAWTDARVKSMADATEFGFALGATDSSEAPQTHSMVLEGVNGVTLLREGDELLLEIEADLNDTLTIE